MRIVHTGDVHLDPAHPERLNALRQVCKQAAELQAGLLIIAGDLFDSESAATQLRPDVRSLFDALPFDLLLVAGNHDEDAYPEGAAYGERVTVVPGEEGILVHEFGDLPFTALPFHRGRRAGDVLAGFEGPALILVAHASFFTSDPHWSAIPREIQEEEPEEAGTEFSLLQEDVAAKGFAYVALGHWHQPMEPPIRVGDTQIAYCGSTYPLSRREIGRRKFALVDVDGNGTASVSFVPIDGVPYVVEHELFVVFGQEEQALAQVRTMLAGDEASPLATLYLRVEGYLAITEQDFRRELQAVVQAGGSAWGHVQPDFRAIQVDVAGQDALAQFLESLEGISVPDISDISAIFSEPELQEIALRLLQDDPRGLKADALALGLRAFQDVRGR